MSSWEFGLFCLVGFTLPVPILAWLDRVSSRGGSSGRRS
jgi:hypothetical protein